MDATPSPTFDAELFDLKCAEKGAVTWQQKADLVGVDWSTIHRFRKGDYGPRLTVARQIADRLGVSVDDLWPGA
jgi:DNA-binding XRE family transcriptional regulator